MIFVLWTFAPGSFIDITDENPLKADYLKKLDELGIITAEDALRAVKEDDFSFNWIEDVPEQEEAGGLDDWGGNSAAVPPPSSPLADRLPAPQKCDSALRALGINKNKTAATQDAAGEEFKEADHPRDESRRWTSGSGSTGGGTNKESKNISPEKQRKIDSIKIDFSKDNILPELNKEDLEALGKESKPVLFKKSTIFRNLGKHSDIDKTEYDYLIGQALYNDPTIFPGFKDDYMNFIKKISDKENSLVLLELAETKENYEIVHVMKINDEGLKRMKRKSPK